MPGSIVIEFTCQILGAIYQHFVPKKINWTTQNIFDFSFGLILNKRVAHYKHSRAHLPFDIIWFGIYQSFKFAFCFHKFHLKLTQTLTKFDWHFIHPLQFSTIEMSTHLCETLSTMCELIPIQIWYCMIEFRSRNISKLM